MSIKAARTRIGVHSVGLTGEATGARKKHVPALCRGHLTSGLGGFFPRQRPRNWQTYRSKRPSPSRSPKAALAPQLFVRHASRLRPFGESLSIIVCGRAGWSLDRSRIHRGPAVVCPKSPHGAAHAPKPLGPKSTGDFAEAPAFVCGKSRFRASAGGCSSRVPLTKKRSKIPVAHRNRENALPADADSAI